MPLPALTIDELVAYLNNTRIPTVLVEGDGDLAAFRWIETTLGTLAANVFPCRGRSTLLALFARRGELRSRLAFLADLDVFVYTGVPLTLRDIVWTEGYCIENDIFSDARDQLFCFLNPEEMPVYNELLTSVCEWFAGTLYENETSGTGNFSTHVNHLVSHGTNTVAPRFLYIGVPKELVEHVFENHVLLLRGKQQFQVLARILGTTGRRPQYSYPQLVDLALRGATSRPRLTRLLTEILDALHA